MESRVVTAAAAQSVSSRNPDVKPPGLLNPFVHPRQRQHQKDTTSPYVMFNRDGTLHRQTTTGTDRQRTLSRRSSTTRSVCRAIRHKRYGRKKTKTVQSCHPHPATPTKNVQNPTELRGGGPGRGGGVRVTRRTTPSHKNQISTRANQKVSPPEPFLPHPNKK